jgi:hypothetical protein
MFALLSVSRACGLRPDVDARDYPAQATDIRGGPAIYEVNESTLSVTDFYFLEPNDHQPDLAALGDPVSVPVG